MLLRFQEENQTLKTILQYFILAAKKFSAVDFSESIHDGKNPNTTIESFYIPFMPRQFLLPRQFL